MSQRDVNSMLRGTVSTQGTREWADRVAHRLIHHAARTAPASLSERLEEEWLADLATRRAAVARLCFALGCCWATRAIARDLGAPRVAAANSSAVMYGQPNLGYLSRRSSALLLVASLHAVLLYGLITKLSHIYSPATPDHLQNQQLDPRPSEKLPLLPEPQLKATKIDVLKPELNVPEGPDTSEDVVGNAGPETSPPSSPLSTSQPHVVRQVPGGPGVGFPSSDDFYPAQAKRMEEQGIATVRVCVDTNGRLTSDPATVQTSGSSRLDQGAMQLAKAGSGHYRPTTEDGRAVNSCYSFRVRFELKN